MLTEIQKSINTFYKQKITSLTTAHASFWDQRTTLNCRDHLKLSLLFRLRVDALQNSFRNVTLSELHTAYLSSVKCIMPCWFEIIMQLAFIPLCSY